LASPAADLTSAAEGAIGVDQVDGGVALGERQLVLLSDWAVQQGPLTMLWLLRQIGRLLRCGVLTTEIGASYPLEKIQEAVRQAEAPGRRGKVLLQIDNAWMSPGN
jgi:NADPH:quinone reductase-like Zn-dependent oxidoreductase